VTPPLECHVLFEWPLGLNATGQTMPKANDEISIVR